MKNVITFLMCTLCILTGLAQSDLTQNKLQIPERTPELQSLFEQAKYLEENGSAAEINANRLAIKNAWQQIDPDIAALYKPLECEKLPETLENLHINGVYIPEVINNRPLQPEFPEDWGTDNLLLSEYIDGGVDMDVTSEGDIYISAFKNDIEGSGASSDKIIIFRSTDHGNTFTEWKRVEITAPMRKLQIISIDGSGTNYLAAYILTASNTFQVWRWPMSGGSMESKAIAGNVVDFAVDRNYPGNTNSQRIFCTYVKADDSVYSARTTAGSYGFDWVDLYDLGIVGEQVDFAYGLDGGCFTTFIGKNSRNVRAITNSSFNDPTAWGPFETLTDGNVVEVVNPTIRAARRALPNEKVVIWASQRPAGSSSHFDGIGLLRTAGGAYTNFSDFPAGGGGDWSVVHTDGWVRKSNNRDEIRFSYVRANVPGTENSSNRSLTFNGNDFDTFEAVADPDVNVWRGFASATAETHDGLPCLAFAGTSPTGAYGFGLYFDRKSTLGMEENKFEDFNFYPNPAQDILNLSATKVIDNVSIFSLLGQKVMDVPVNQNTSSIHIESLAQGVYVMKVSIDGATASYKIIKE